MNNTEIKFVDTSKECIDMMKKLSKQGLKASGKIITKVLKEKIPVRTGGLKKSIVAWAKIDYKTGIPYMEVGYRSRQQMKKRGVKFFVNPWWFEFGTKPHEIMTNEMKNKGKSSYELHDHQRNYGVIVQHPGMGQKNFLRNSSSVIIGIFSFFADRFLDEVELLSLLIRMVVFFETDPITLPPAFSISDCNSLRFLN